MSTDRTAYRNFNQLANSFKLNIKTKSKAKSKKKFDSKNSNCNLLVKNFLNSMESADSAPLIKTELPKSKNKKSLKQLNLNTARSGKRSNRQSKINSKSLKDPKVILAKIQKAIDDQSLDLKRLNIKPLKNNINTAKGKMGENKIKIQSTKFKLLSEFAKTLKLTKIIAPSKPKADQLLPEKLKCMSNKKNSENINRIEAESKIEFHVNETMVGTSSLLDAQFNFTQKFEQNTNKETLNVSQQTNQDINSGVLNQSSFLRIIDRLNEDDKSARKDEQKVKRENEVEINKLDLNFNNEKLKVINSENINQDQSFCINQLKMSLLRNIKSKELNEIVFSLNNKQCLNTERYKHQRIVTEKEYVDHGKSEERTLVKTKSFTKLPMPRGSKTNRH